MSGAFEGDLIRPLGLVILYASYAEGELDELLAVLLAPSSFDDTKRTWPVGRKLTYALTLVRRLRAESLTSMEATLQQAKVLFERRNALVHGRIFSGGRVVSGRSNIQNQVVSPEDLVLLAEQIFSWKEQISMNRQRYLQPLLAMSKARK
jgi:hypothetical protein